MNKLPPIFLLFSISFFATCDKKIDIETGLAEVNSTQLYYEVAGTGTPIVLIHGHGGDRRHWDDQFEAFAKNHKVIRYDVRGFGKSAKPVLEQSYSNHDDLKALLQHLGISKAHICGFSPASPASGPRSMTQSAVLIKSILCSMQMTVLPKSTSRCKTSSSLRKSSKCRPVVGSSRM